MLAILAAALLAASPSHDTVFTADGGRVLGTVVEEGPQGVAVQLPDGTFRRLARREVLRIEYKDGTVSKPAEPAPSPPAPTPPPAQAYPPPPAYAPPPPPAYLPPPYPVRPHHPPPVWAEPVRAEPRGGGPLSPIYLSFGLGAAGLSGEAERDVDVDRVLGSQFAVSFEGGVRLSPHLALGLYIDGGVGDPGSEYRAFCNDNVLDCTAATGRVGLLLRATLEPAAPVTPWISLGTGFESSTVEFDDGFATSEITYSGWEMLRLQGGVDFRSGRVIGVGLYGGVRFGRYGRFEGSDGIAQHIGPDRTVHTTIEGGLRFTLFP